MVMSSSTLSTLDLTQVDFDRIQAALAGLDRPACLTLKSVIESHRDAIAAARRRGLSYETIAAALTSAGCPIKPATLRKYIGPSKPVPRTVTSLSQPSPPANPIDVAALSQPSQQSQRRSLRRSTYLTPEFGEEER